MSNDVLSQLQEFDQEIQTARADAARAEERVAQTKQKLVDNADALAELGIDDEEDVVKLETAAQEHAAEAQKLLDEIKEQRGDLCG